MNRYGSEQQVRFLLPAWPVREFSYSLRFLGRFDSSDMRGPTRLN